MKHEIDKGGARQADLAKIHIAKKELQMADDTYRALLRAIGGVDSASQLDFTGRKRLLEHFKGCGWNGNTGGKRPRRPTPSEAAAPLCRKIRAQLISLGNLHDSYADGIAKQMFNVQFYEWCQPDQLHAIVAALGKEQARKGVAYKPTHGGRS